MSAEDRFERLIATLYAEKDFARSIATAIAGLAGLLTYFWKDDWVVAAFAAVIVFPLVRVIADAARSRWLTSKQRSSRDRDVAEIYGKLSDQEKEIVRFFLMAGGACVSWGFVNSSSWPFPRPALNTLMARGLVRESIMEDGLTESFVLDIDLFDYARSQKLDFNEDVPF